MQQGWHLIGAVEGESNPRSFHIADFTRLNVRPEAATIPENFDLGDFLGNAGGIQRGSQPYDIEIEFDRQAARAVTETTWHRTQQVHRHRNGKVTLTFNVDGLEEIVPWILGWSGRAKVIRPESLRQLVVEQLQAALLLNGSSQ